MGRCPAAFPRREGMHILDSGPDCQLAPDQWERFELALGATTSVGWVDVLLSALESGEISARANSDPPATGNEKLDAVVALSPSWWAHYKAAIEDSSLPRGTQLTTWLLSEARVELGPTLRLFAGYFEQARDYFRDRRHPGQSADVWSDLEAFAWFVSNDSELVDKLRHFGHQEMEFETKARSEGLRYLQIASCGCSSGANRLLLVEFPTGCNCTKSAFDKLLASLRTGHLTAQLVGKDRKSRSVEPGEFMTATWNAASRQFALIAEVGELQFDRAQVQSATQEPKGQRQAAPEPFSIPEMKKWINGHPEYTNVKSARNAFVGEDRAKGLSASFEGVWREVHGRTRGRPPKKES